MPTLLKWLCQFAVREFLLLYILVSIVSFLNFGLFNRCVVVSCLNLPFPDDMLWCIFSCAYLPSVYLLCYLLKSLAFFLIRLFYCCLQTSLYILDNMSFANIFCQFVVCLLILLMLSFTKQFIILMKFNLSVVSFMDHAFDFVTWEVIAIFKVM